MAGMVNNAKKSKAIIIIWEAIWCKNYGLQRNKQINIVSRITG